MDDIIQSLVQSPILNALENVEHSTKRFTNDIPDNAPYRTIQKRILEASSGDRSDPGSTLRFNILRHGQLNKMYLKASLFFPFTPLDSGATASFTQSSKSLDTSFFASFFTSASLYVGGKCVETMYPENIMAKAFQSSPSVRDTILYWLKGKMSDYGEDEVGDGAFDLSVGDGGTRLEKYGNFMIPLDFSLFQFSKDALDTTMLQQCYVEVRKRAIRGFQTEVAGATTKCQLICKYFNLEYFFKNQIRNTNFSKETSTLITMDNVAIPQVCEEEITSAEGYIKTEFEIDTFAIPPIIVNGFGGSPNPASIFSPGHNIPDGSVVTLDGVVGMNLAGDFVATVVDSNYFTIPFDATDMYQITQINQTTGHLSLWPGGGGWLDTGDIITLVNVPAPHAGMIGTWTITKLPGNVFTLDGYVHNGLGASHEATGSYQALTPIETFIETFPAFKRCVFDFNTVHDFITEILITFRKKNVSSPDDFYGDVVASPSSDGFLRFTLKCEDTVLFDKFHYEMMVDTLNTSDQYINDVTSSAGGMCVFGPEGNFTRYINTTSLSVDAHVADTFPLRNVPTMYRIPFTMFHGEEFHNGGLNLKTLSNVKLIIEGTDLLDEVISTDSRGLVPHIVLRRRTLSRVDGQTGSISSHF